MKYIECLQCFETLNESGGFINEDGDLIEGFCSEECNYCYYSCPCCG
jgi:hypothetical protein